MRRNMSSKHGVVILNLGSPKSPEVPDVRKYLREFLGDDRVLDTNPILKAFVLNLILLLRPAKSAAAYKSVWTPEGPPLLVITEKLRKAVQAVSGEVKVYTAMRYAEPSCDNVAKRIAADGITDVLIIPQYPQYAMSSYETAEVRLREALAEHSPATRYTLLQRYRLHRRDGRGGETVSG
jgi:protoporphyrin/coproporphyrin ferrochelatase